MSDVFISYSRRDATFVNALEDRLTARGIDVWIDRRQLPVSMPWREGVDYALSGSMLVVACRSDAFARSEHCSEELAIAARRGTPVLDVDVGAGVTPAVERIGDAVADAGATGRLRAELTRRATDWARAGHPRGRLVGGKLVRDARAALRKGELVLAADAGAFLTASRRRDRRRQWLAALGAGMLLNGVVAHLVIKHNREDNERKVAKNATTVERVRSIAQTIERDPYAGLVRAAQEAIKADPDAFEPRDRLMRALAVSLPVSSSEDEPPPTRLLARACASRSSSPCRSHTVGASTALSRPHDGVVEVRRGALMVRRISVGGRAGALALSPDQRTLAVGRRTDVALYSVATGTPVGRLRGSLGSVRSVYFSRDGGSVSALAGARRVSTWRWRQATLLADRPRGWFVALSPVREDATAVAVDRSGTLTRVDTSGRSRARDLPSRLRGPVISAAFAPDGRRAIVLLGSDELVQLDLATGAIVNRRKVPCSAFDVASTPEGDTAWVSCANAPLLRVDTGTLRTVGRAEALPGTFKAAPFGEEVFAASQASIVFATAEGAKPEELFVRPCARFGGLTISPQGTTLFVVGDGAGKIGCSAVGTRHPDGTWTFNIAAIPRRPGQESRVARFSPDGRVVAIGYSDGSIATFTLPNHTPGWVRDGAHGQIRGLSFTSDGSQLVAATRDGVVEMLPACPSCFDTRGLARLALDRVAHAHRLGLTTVAVPRSAQASPGG